MAATKKSTRKRAAAKVEAPDSGRADDPREYYALLSAPTNTLIATFSDEQECLDQATRLNAVNASAVAVQVKVL